jgi:hypothetical protein
VTQELRDYAATAVNLILSEEKGFENARIAPELIQKITMAIAGGADITQHMTDRLVTLQSYVVAVAKGTGDLGDAFKKISKEISEGTRQMMAAVQSFTEINRQLSASFDAQGSPAVKRYLEVNYKIVDLGDRLDTTWLRRQNQLLFERELVKELTTEAEKQKFGHEGLVYANDALTQSFVHLTAAERLRLPLIIDETSRLGQLLQASESVVSEMMTNELPARQRINLQIQRQADLAYREIQIKPEFVDWHALLYSKCCIFMGLRCENPTSRKLKMCASNL